MSYIKWLLDTEDGIDAYDLLEEIYIIGDRGKIEDKCIFLDTFFGALVEGVQLIKEGQTNEVDSVDEPDDIIFDYTGDNLVISYGKQKITIKDKDKLAKDLKQSIQELLQVTDCLPVKPGKKKIEFTKLREFIKLA